MELTELVPEPAAGRIFELAMQPGIADAVGDGRVRLDAIARWLQDVAYADLLDAGFDERGMWIVRRLRLRVESWPRFGEPVSVRTFCSGLGRFSAERRTTVAGDSGRVDAVALWVWIDESGRPARFGDRVRRPLRGERRRAWRARAPAPPRAAGRGRAHAVDVSRRRPRRRRPRQQLALLGAARGALRGSAPGRDRRRDRAPRSGARGAGRRDRGRRPRSGSWAPTAPSTPRFRLLRAAEARSSGGHSDGGAGRGG